MFDRLRRALGRQREPASLPAGPHTPLARWADGAGLALTHPEGSADFSLSGPLAGKALRLDRTASTRDYIEGAELRARVALGVATDLSVMVINRALRDRLEHAAYQGYTDRVRTTLDASMPEEVRWLAMLDEVGWERGAVPTFWSHYACVADTREHAQAWLSPALMQALLDWPTAADPVLPLILQLQRGKLYLRCAFAPQDLPTLQHVLRLLEQAGAAAQAGCPARA